MALKQEFIDFSDMSGGKNSAFPAHAIAANQVVETINLIHERVGITRSPGYMGLSDEALFASPIRGMWAYKHYDGSETLIVVSGLKIYSINISEGTKTEIGSIAGDGECYAVNAVGKLWIVNGTSFVKVENDLSVYAVGLQAMPSGSAVLKAGGTLAAGLYACYGGYARKTAGGLYLYGLPKSLGNVTLGGGNGTITFTLPDSSDPQVTHKIAWMTEAGGSVPYYFGEALNTIPAFDITGNANENTSVRMDTEAATNSPLPINPSGIFYFNDRLHVWAADGQTLYFSMIADINPFSFERFPPENFRTLANTISALFNVGDDLFINTIGLGIAKIPGGDMTAITKKVQQNNWFLKCKTENGCSYVEFFKGIVWGLTNDGVRCFDGNSFSDDLSFNIKPDIERIIAGASSSFIPAIIIFRRKGKRTELRISFRDIQISSQINNSQFVFNLDFYAMADENGAPKKTWEYWETGFAAYAIIAEALYAAQTTLTEGTIIREGGVADKANYDNNGAFQTSQIEKRIYIKTRTILDRLNSISIWGSIYTLAISNAPITGNGIVFDAANVKYPFLIEGKQAAIAILPSATSGLGLLLPFVMGAVTPTSWGNRMPFSFRGNTVALEFEQTANDADFIIYSLQMPVAFQVTHNAT
jgi:hypothetical protein